MKAQSKLIEKSTALKPILEYPILMKSITTDSVILFTNTTTGMVVNVNQSSMEGSTLGGEYSDKWVDCNDSGKWEIFKGKIELENQ